MLFSHLRLQLHKRRLRQTHADGVVKRFFFELEVVPAMAREKNNAARARAA
jgi:hypothetical protein